jgi:hypothetical protein
MGFGSLVDVFMMEYTTYFFSLQILDSFLGKINIIDQVFQNCYCVQKYLDHVQSIYVALYKGIL